MADPRASRKTTHTSADAAHIVSRGEQVRQRIRDLTATTIRERDLKFNEVRDLVGEILHGAAEGVRSAIPANRSSVLRQVFEGVSDAMAASIKATQRAVDAARERGERLAGRDLRALGRGVAEAEQHFLDSVAHFTSRIGGTTRATLRDMVAQARQAGTSIRPAAAAALKSAGQDPLALVSESVQAGAKLAQQAASGALLAAGGMLSGVGAAIKPAPRRPSRRNAARKPAAKKAATKRSAAKKKATRVRAKPRTGKKTAARKRPSAKRSGRKRTRR